MCTVPTVHTLCSFIEANGRGQNYWQDIAVKSHSWLLNIQILTRQNKITITSSSDINCHLFPRWGKRDFKASLTEDFVAASQSPEIWVDLMALIVALALLLPPVDAAIAFSQWLVIALASTSIFASLLVAASRRLSIKLAVSLAIYCNFFADVRLPSLGLEEFGRFKLSKNTFFCSLKILLPSSVFNQAPSTFFWAVLSFFYSFGGYQCKLTPVFGQRPIWIRTFKILILFWQVLLSAFLLATGQAGCK